MSFGFRDEDWVDPDETKIVKCEDCDSWIPCPCYKCGYGWCDENGDFTEKDEACEW